MDINKDIRIPFALVVEDQFEPLLEAGFRMMNLFYFRHTSSFLYNRSMKVKSLRLRLSDYSFSKSQRKILRTHDQAFTVTLSPIKIEQAEEDLFSKHCLRFPSEYHGMSIYQFLNTQSAKVPVRGMCLKVFYDGNLIAVSYLHIGSRSMSATYGIHDPDYTAHSLGTYTMLKEIELAQRYGLTYYYHGYAYDQPSQFDYKYNFNALECLDWDTMAWEPHERMPVRNWRELRSEQVVDERGTMNEE